MSAVNPFYHSDEEDEERENGHVHDGRHERRSNKFGDRTRGGGIEKRSNHNNDDEKEEYEEYDDYSAYTDESENGSPSSMDRRSSRSSRSALTDSSEEYQEQEGSRDENDDDDSEDGISLEHNRGRTGGGEEIGEEMVRSDSSDVFPGNPNARKRQHSKSPFSSSLGGVSPIVGIAADVQTLASFASQYSKTGKEHQSSSPEKKKKNTDRTSMSNRKTKSIRTERKDDPDRVKNGNISRDRKRSQRYGGGDGNSGIPMKDMV